MTSRLPVEFLFLKNPIRYSNYIDKFGLPEFDNFFIYFSTLPAMLSENYINFLNLLGIKYIIQENDVAWYFANKKSGIYSPQMMHYLFNSKEYLEKTKTHNKIDIYKVKKEFYQPIIYPSRRIIEINGPVYGFSSWKTQETESFSILKSEDLTTIKQDNFSFAKQIVLETKKPGKPKKEESFNFNISREGDYGLVILIQDNGKINNFAVSYVLDNLPSKNKKITIQRDWPFQKDWENLGYTKTFYSIPLGEERLSPGEHSLTIRIPAFVNKESSSLIYLALNKEFLKRETEKRKALPKIEFEKKSQTKFLLRVTNSNYPYLLNFAQNFDPGWKLYIKKDKKKIQINTPHLTTSNLNNIWYLDPGKLSLDSDYELLLLYAPQRIFIYALVISGAASLFGLIYVLKIKFKSKK